MIWRDGNYVGVSFWLGEAMVCPEYFATWGDPDNTPISAGDTASVGNHGPLLHGLSSLAVPLAMLLLIVATPTARASRHCLDHAEAARTWPTLALIRDGDGCWTHDRHPPRLETPMPGTPAQVREATLADRWVDAGMLRLDLPELEPKHASEAPSPPGPLESTRQFALFVWIVLAVTSVVAVATGGHTGRASRPRWPDRKAPSGFDRG